MEPKMKMPIIENESYCRVVRPRVSFKYYLCPKCRIGILEHIKYNVNPLLAFYQVRCPSCRLASKVCRTHGMAIRNFVEKSTRKK